MEADDQEGIPALVERMSELPQADQAELAELISAAECGLEVERTRLEGEAEAVKEARQIFLTAQEKLEDEGRPVDPNMTVEEAYAILQGARGPSCCAVSHDQDFAGAPGWGWWHHACSGEGLPAGLSRQEKGGMRPCTRG
jgi:hypothetical protein